LERAHKRFFATRADFPRFKRKGDAQCFRYPDAKQFEINQFNSRIKLPKLGWIRYRNTRDVLGAAKNFTVSQPVGN
jgi:putative transposase